MWTYNYSNELYHHGIKGMKWGRRRYQNSDGSLTSAGRSRYGETNIFKRADNKRKEFIANRAKKKADKAFREQSLKKYNEEKHRNKTNYDPNFELNELIRMEQEADRNHGKKVHYVEKNSNDIKAYKQTPEAQAAAEKKQIPEAQQAAAEKRKKTLKVGAAVAGTALAAYGGYKLSKYIKNENGKNYRERGRAAAREILNEGTLRGSVSRNTASYNINRVSPNRAHVNRVSPNHAHVNRVSPNRINV